MKKETESKSDRTSDEQFRSFGRFDPLEAKRLLTRFEEADIRFQISGVDYSPDGGGDTVSAIQFRRDTYP